MARKARIKSSTGIYHVLVRAIADLSLFTDDEDASIYIQTLRDLQSKGLCTVYAYAFFDTHLHLLIKTSPSTLSQVEETSATSATIPEATASGFETIGQVMKRLASNYSYFFNVKYDHYGPIYLDRFKSEPIEDRTTFLRCLDFISSQPTEWKGIITNTLPSLPTIPNGSSLGKFLDIKLRPKRLTDSKLLDILKTQYGYTNIGEFLQRSISDQEKVASDCKKIGGSIRQIVRITGMPFAKVATLK